ncbi:hypothetical protein [uncultured Microbacterium sp.]|uniref:hypothetical protein n=1 Tax=uncultured Microbacterium sp. TaxID=191216 RepID=UPI003747A502
MKPIDFDDLEDIAAELRDASATLEAVFAARGVPAGAGIDSDDDEAMAAVDRMRRALARQAAWLDATI